MSRKIDDLQNCKSVETMQKDLNRLRITWHINSGFDALYTKADPLDVLAGMAK
jgi:hypothetical protein